MESPRIPRLFAAAGTKRGLVSLIALTALSGAAMLPALVTLANHGASVFAFESAGGVSRSQEILGEWGSAGKAAMWWQLVIDIPFMVGYGLFFAGACAAVSRRAGETRHPRLERAGAVLAWLGPIAAAADLLQNFSLALVLAGHVSRPWPRIAAGTAPVTLSLCAVAGAFALAGALATRRPRRT